MMDDAMMVAMMMGTSTYCLDEVFLERAPRRFIRAVKDSLEVLSNTYWLPVDRMTDQVYANMCPNVYIDLQLQTNQ
jgi:hypothetical protein